MNRADLSGLEVHHWCCMITPCRAEGNSASAEVEFWSYGCCGPFVGAVWGVCFQRRFRGLQGSGQVQARWRIYLFITLNLRLRWMGRPWVSAELDWGLTSSQKIMQLSTSDSIDMVKAKIATGSAFSNPTVVK